MFKELDKNGDGKLTGDEIPADRRSFFDHLVRSSDKDGDGQLTLGEFLNGLKPADKRGASEGDRPAGDSRPDPARLFQRLDRNGDGKVELDELPEQLRERLRPAFELLGKTAVDRDDFAKVAERMRRDRTGPMAGERGRGPAFFRKLDKDGDGRLSKDELQQAAQIFDDLDTNKDGFLDVREFFGGPRPEGEASRDDRRPAGDKGAPAKPAVKPDAAAADQGAQKPAVPPAIATKGAGKKDGKGPLRKFDANGDGKVSRDEAQGRIKKNFDRLDTNGDGVLDRDELRKALEELKPGKENDGLKA